MRGAQWLGAEKSYRQQRAKAAMFQPWSSEDFISAAESRPRSADFWEPDDSLGQSSLKTLPPKPAVRDFWEASWSPAQLETNVADDGACAFDFWDPYQPQSSKMVRPVSDWSETIPLPLFDARASENPFRLEEASPQLETITRRCARWLASLLDLPTREARRRYAAKFEVLFDEFPHHNTFRVLSELAIEGATAEQILGGFELRQVWQDNPIFWSLRRKGYRGPVVPDGGDKQLGWTKAIRLSDLARGLPAEQMIDHDWYEEWLRLPYGDPLYWSFLEYATARLDSFSNGVLALPESLSRQEGYIPDDRLRTRPIWLDGMKIGSLARTGILVRLETNSPLNCRKVAKSEDPPNQAEAAE